MFRTGKYDEKGTAKGKPAAEVEETKYAAKKRRERDRNATASKAGRDIGKIPDIVNIKRRERCKFNFRLFCETYNPEAFKIKWSKDHLRCIKRIEEAVLSESGALFAFAMPRGSGKSTLCRMAILWALAYGHKRYPFFIGANSTKATDALEAVKIYCRFLPLFVEDFPEISYPVARIGGIANRAGGQLCQGQPTLISWGKEAIVFPTVPPPENWPKKWPLRSDGMVPTSGSAVSTSGLTGDGIRGSLLTLITGESIRPDFVAIDDPQSHESANSPTQNATREQLISADVLGMAGAGKPISAVMPCTVIQHDDMIDRILDRSKHPLWRGERTKMMISMPIDMAAWDEYFAVYHHCAQLEPPNYKEANAHYRKNRDRLDAGAEAAWPQRKLSGEVSAIQHAMHLYARDRRAFMSEYQNDPEDAGSYSSLLDLNTDAIAARVTRIERFIVPRESTRLTAFIDVHKELLYYAVAAFDERFSGSVIDYGEWPRQNRHHFSLTGAKPVLSDRFPNMPEDAVIFAGLTELIPAILKREYLRDGDPNERLTVARCLIDTGYKPDTVFQAVRQSGFASIITPSKGYSIGAKGRPMAEWQKKAGEQTGWHWRIGAGTGGGRGRAVLLDTNHWKTFAAERLLTPPGAAGCVQLFGSKPYDHQLFAEHLSAEYPTQTFGHGRTVNEWQVRPDRVDNHWFDCFVGCVAAASIAGLQWSASAAAGMPEPPKPKKKKLDIEELNRLANGG